MEMLSRPTEDLRREYFVACNRATADRSAMSEQSRIRALVDRLVYRGDSIEWAREQLVNVKGSDGWVEIWLFALLLKRRTAPSSPMRQRDFARQTRSTRGAVCRIDHAMKELATPRTFPC